MKTIGKTTGKTIEEIYSHLADAPSQKTLERVDYEARHWSSDIPGPLKPGTEEHKRATAQMFRDTFNPYKPSVIPWPELAPETLHRITSLPIWDIAVQTEGKARLRMAAYAAMIDDPDMKDALSRNAWEENRHKEVLSKLIEAYQIKMAPEPPYVEPKDTEWAYLVTGFSECLDSFFAFGLFALAERSGLFPLELVETFEPVMQEECRHILLFANWLAWHRAVMPVWKRPWFEIRVLGVWLFLAYERMGLARSMDENGTEQTQDNNFTVSGAKDVTNIDIKIPDLMQLCLDENERRFAGYDPRLKRPTTTPAIARAVIKGIALWDRVQSRFEKRRAH